VINQKAVLRVIIIRELMLEAKAVAVITAVIIKQTIKRNKF